MSADFLKIDPSRANEQTFRRWLAALGLLAIFAWGGEFLLRQSVRSSAAGEKALLRERDDLVAQAARQRLLLRGAANADRERGARSDKYDFAIGKLPFLARALEFDPYNLAAAEEAAEFLSDDFGQSLEGHGGGGVRANFSADGRKIVTASGDQTAKIWEVATGRCLAILSGHTSRLRTASFSPDGRRVVTASNDRTARVWHAETGALLAILREPEKAVRTAQISGDGALVLTRSDEEVRGDGTLVLTESEEEVARLWSAEDGKLLHTFAMSEDRGVFDAELSPQGDRIVTSSAETFQLWDARTGQRIATLPNLHQWHCAMKFSSDGARLLTLSDQDSARLWDAGNGHLVATLRGLFSDALTVHFSKDGAMVFAAFEDQRGRIWNTQTGEAMAVREHELRAILQGRFEPEAARAVGVGDDYYVHVWDTASGQTRQTFKSGGDAVMDMKLSPDGKRIVITSWPNSIRICEIPALTLPAPAWFPKLLRLAALKRLDRDGECREIRPLVALGLRAELECAMAREPSRYVEFARWFLADFESRTCRPGMPERRLEAAEALLTSHATEAEVKCAAQLIPAHPLIPLYNARFAETSELAARFWKYGLQRVSEEAASGRFGPPALLWERAAEQLAQAPLWVRVVGLARYPELRGGR